MKDELLRLAELCEKADGLDRGLDGSIAQAQGWRHYFVQKDIWWRTPDGRSVADLLRFTSSIDVALSLVSEDAFWRVGHDGEGPDPSLFRADVMYTPGSGHHIARAATPALALCAASLRALAAMEDAHD